ncbi:uncharacterized protein BCR38DRAFT_453765 [Pseudomassariella vexata]|uniref:Spindle pole body-associated protein cut12 domain-containing protein n=1 Tax=Pseudomassariella vexata TaxID=1141098 RepID=A0A1Y2EHU6_9PEZI|nr:uncharacterized protein BCR38DRAFT_453765 [Pseudomassariella vexata]ORY71148.1 hypothetical protein BCR38DRAFT_453765 [Pseudomassariella vexata]
MLGWAIKKGFQGATGPTDAAVGTDDTAQFEAPDTPAPVFAARAIKYALFGTPVQPRDVPVEAKRAEPTTTTKTTATTDATSKDIKSPMRPSGILLTPGTGTVRRKRVSFGHDVKTTTHGDPDALAAGADGTGQTRKKTTLQQTLENSRSTKAKKLARGSHGTTEGKRPAKDEGRARARLAESDEEHSEGEWEDEICNHDVTYWKSEFTKYSEDARIEMAKLKDAEAQKIVKMEKKISDLAAQVVDQRKRGVDTDTASLMKKLAEKTALAVEYREQELSNANHRRMDASPRTEQAIYDANRELKKVKSELKEMNSLRREVERLKSDLLYSQQRATKLGEENRRLADEAFEPSRAKKLEKQLREAKDQSQQKDDELKKLRKDFDTFKGNAKASHSQAIQLEKEIKNFKARDDAASQPRSLSASLRSDIECLNKPTNAAKFASRHPPKRSASVEDFTLDMTQRSFLNDDTYPRPMETGLSRRSSIDFTDSMFDIDEQLKRDKKQQMESLKRDRELFTDEFDFGRTGNQAKEAPSPNPSQPAHGSRRSATDVLFDKSNVSSPKDSHRRRNDRITSTSSTNKDDMMHGALDRITSGKPSSRFSRPLSPTIEAPGIDLVRDRFARLGGLDLNNSVMTANTSRCTLPAEHLENEIAELEARLRTAKQRLASTFPQREQNGNANSNALLTQPPPGLYAPDSTSSHHYLLLLSDSALPLGSFAFSSGLESYLAHNRGVSSFSTFLLLSLSSYASTTLPFVLAAHRDPVAVAELDDQLDAAIICTVGRRASVAQGRALLSIWERSFVLRKFARRLRSSSSSSAATISKSWSSSNADTDIPPVSAHLAPLFGAISKVLGLTLQQTAYVFLLSHVKALISAAVRASVFGPYQAQKVLAGMEVQAMITALVEREWETRIEEAGQSVPVMDLWIGRHEMLYSRIFNS